MDFRPATRADIPAVMALLADDALGQHREHGDTTAYLAAFEAMQDEDANHLIVGEDEGGIAACYQITFITGLSLAASRRAQLEGVRVAASRRRGGAGAALIADAEARARAAGCSLLQLTTNRSRRDAHRFYDRMGFVASHVGYKKQL